MGIQRRSFLRLLGAGTAASLGTSGCTSEIPESATAAWRDAARETDPRRWALAHAVLAPHSHNLQSWLVELPQADTIVLRCDLERLLPQTDPLSRQIMLSQGTFLELLDLAARERGQRAEIRLFPEGAFAADKPDTRPVAHIRLVADAGVARDPLFAQITRRRTNRERYDPTREVPAAARSALAAAASILPGLQLGWVDAQQPDALAAHRRIASEAWRIELQTARTFAESLNVMRVGAAEVARHRDGLTVMDPFAQAMAAIGLFDRKKVPAPDSFVIKGQLDDFNAKMASTPAFLWMSSQGNDRITQVQAGRAYARVQLAATAAGLVMQPLSQALQEYAEVAQPYAEIHRLAGAAPPERTVQMWLRVGHAANPGPSPRRGLDAHLVRR